MYLLKFSDRSFSILDNNEGFEEAIEVNSNEYNKYLELKNEEKVFRLKETQTGNGLFDYIEEYIPDIQEDIEEDIVKRVELLEEENAALLIDSAVKDRKIVQLETDMADIMKEIVLGGTN